MRATQQQLVQRLLQQLVSNSQQLELGVVSAASHGMPSCSVSTSGILSLRFFSCQAHGRAPHALQQHISTMMRASLRQVGNRELVHHPTQTRLSVQARGQLRRSFASDGRPPRKSMMALTLGIITTPTQTPGSGTTPKAKTPHAAPPARPQPTPPRAPARRTHSHPSWPTCSRLPRWYLPRGSSPP